MESSWRRRGEPAAAGLALAVLIGCTPTFDWRETRAEGAGLLASFPCRPDHHSRSVPVGAVTVRMEMLVCNAGGATYAVNFYDAADASAVESGLESLRATVLSNVQAGPPRSKPLKLAGSAALRVSADGHRPDGVALRLEAAFFAKNLRVYQAAIVGPPLTDDAVDPFFEGLQLTD